jgi:hypothetical protein
LENEPSLSLLCGFAALFAINTLVLSGSAALFGEKLCFSGAGANIFSGCAAVFLVNEVAAAEPQRTWRRDRKNTAFPQIERQSREDSNE